MTNTNKAPGGMTMADLDRAVRDHMHEIPQYLRTTREGAAVRAFAHWLIRQFCSR